MVVSIPSSLDSAALRADFPFLEEQVDKPWQIGSSKMGWTSWLGKPKIGRREDLILDPQAEAVQSTAAA